MTIGEKIKNLRKEKGITQEKLAEYLNLTYQSISKWENNTTMPDITLVVPLANFFGVSTDELLGADTKKETVIQEYDEKSSQLKTDGLVRENIKLWREAAQIYPNDFYVLSQLSAALFDVSCSRGFANEEQKRARLEGISLCTRILEDCTSGEIRARILQLLTYFYSGEGNEEMAVKTAMQAPLIYHSRQMLLEGAYDYNNPERIQLMESNNFIYVESLHQNILSMAARLANRERAWAYHALLTIWNTLIYDGNFLFYHCRMQQIYEELAKTYAIDGNREKTIEFLKQAKYHAEQFDCLPNQEMKYTGIFFSHQTYQKELTSKNYKETHLEVLRQWIGQKCFDFIRGNEEIEKLFSL